MLPTALTNPGSAMNDYINTRMEAGGNLDWTETGACDNEPQRAIPKGFKFSKLKWKYIL